MNATLLHGRFVIPAAKREAALQALIKARDELKRANHFEKDPVFVRLVHAFQILGYDLISDRDTGDIIGLQQRNFDSSDSENDVVFGSLNGIVTPGSYLLFHRDDDELFRWRWGTDGLFHAEEGATIFFGERDSLLVEVRATLQLARQAIKDKAFSTRVDQLLKELRNPGGSQEEAEAKR